MLVVLKIHLNRVILDFRYKTKEAAKYVFYIIQGEILHIFWIFKENGQIEY